MLSEDYVIYFKFPYKKKLALNIHFKIASNKEKKVYGLKKMIWSMSTFPRNDPGSLLKTSELSQAEKLQPPRSRWGFWIMGRKVKQLK